VLIFVLQNGMGALHLAAKEGHVEVLMELLNRGANPEAKTRVRCLTLFFLTLFGKELFHF
jgi:ankyrin